MSATTRNFRSPPEWTFDAVMMTYIGGVGTVVGPVIGAVFFVVVREILALKVADMHLIVFGVLFILVVLFLPGGLVDVWSKVRRALARRAGPGKSGVSLHEKGD